MDNRHTSRVPLIPPCKARFEWGGQAYSGIRVSDIGVNGCCIHAAMPFPDLLTEFPLLDRWEFISPSLPKGSTRARVVWVGHPDGSPGGDLEMGVRFLHPPVGFTNLLFRYVTMRANPSGLLPS